MTIYVDDPMPVAGRFNNWCHMWSATNDRDELDAMAKRLGLKAAWFQLTRGVNGEFPHYDVSPAMRSKALAAGAIYKPLREWIAERFHMMTPALNTVVRSDALALCRELPEAE